ncbi:MAG: GNAT family N-acetyltransferase [Nanoarchaeota archaeon]|nr:GNAT family N-acetyltransferase [Nanoarchaeota archaeon]
MKIRKFRKTDAKEVCNIIRRCDKEIASKDYPKEVINFWDQNLTEEYINQKSNKRKCFVLEENGKVVGYISFDGREIRKLHVNPDFHGRGIGKKLVDKVEKLCIKKRIGKIIVKSSIFAEKFYEKIGFKKVKIIYSNKGHVSFKLIYMEKKL